jgi:hypothetical protein
MSTTYTVNTQEEDSSLRALAANHYQLQVAKSVASGDGSPTCNVVYSSAFLASMMSVSWTTTYGLNWTADIPDPGAKVTHSGEWQQCSLGSSYDLDETGLWKPNQQDRSANPDALHVGRNGYRTAVHIIVGVQDPKTGDWAPVCLPILFSKAEH